MDGQDITIQFFNNKEYRIKTVIIRGGGKHRSKPLIAYLVTREGLMPCGGSSGSAKLRVFKTKGKGAKDEYVLKSIGFNNTGNFWTTQLET